VPPLSHLTPRTSAKSNLYFANSLAAAVYEPDLYRLLTVHIPNLTSLYQFLGLTKVSINVLCTCNHLVTKSRFYGAELLAPRPEPQVGGSPFISCPRLFIQYIRSYPPYWRPFLHWQSEDAPCRCDRFALIMTMVRISQLIRKVFWSSYIVGHCEEDVTFQKPNLRLSAEEKLSN
jgi:hypothetical protein